MDGYLLQLVAIRAHNDELRTRFRGGTVSVSDEVKELGQIVVAHALLTMAEARAPDRLDPTGARTAPMPEAHAGTR